MDEEDHLSQENQRIFSYPGTKIPRGRSLWAKPELYDRHKNLIPLGVLFGTESNPVETLLCSVCDKSNLNEPT